MKLILPLFLCAAFVMTVEAGAQEIADYLLQPSISGGTDYFSQEVSTGPSQGVFTFQKDMDISMLPVSLGAPKYPALFIPECIKYGLLGIGTSIEIKVGFFRLGYKYECYEFSGAFHEMIVTTFSGRKRYDLVRVFE